MTVRGTLLASARRGLPGIVASRTCRRDSCTLRCACAGQLSLGGTTCLTLLVYYGLICFLRQYLSNTAD